MAKQPGTEKTNEDLIRDWDDWLRKRGGKVSLEQVLGLGNHLLFAGMLLKQFRKAARQSVFDRFRREARIRGFSDASPSTGSFFFMIECVANAWSLTNSEKLGLLGLKDVADLEAIRQRAMQDISPDTLERAALLLDIFIVLNAILPQEAADEWIRKPNTAPLFGGKSALTTMIEGGLPALHSVRLYLAAEAAGN